MVQLIDLPWPDKDLSPNSKANHWAVKAEAKRNYRSVAKITASNFLWRNCIKLPEEGNISLKITFYPPTNRKYDMDNLLARMKAGLDGLCDAWGIDDVRFRPITIDIGDKKKDGLVTIQILN